MDSRRDLLVWSDGNPDKWSFLYQASYTRYIVFELSKLPDFSEPRFRYLGERVDDRKAEVAQRQLQMLLQLHGLGDRCAISLRLRRDGTRLRLFTVIRISSDQPLSDDELDSQADRIYQMFPKEYGLVRLSPRQHNVQWQQALNIAWATHVDVLLKPEATYPANTWPYFYSALLWRPPSLNNLEGICRTLLRFPGEAMLDILLVPTGFHQSERDWVDTCVKRMRDAQNGERLYNSDGHLLKTFDPIPGVRVPVENFEDLLKRYDQNRLFLYTFRVFASEDPFSLTQSLAASATRSAPQIISLNNANPRFLSEIRAGKNIDIAPDIRSSWWDEPDTRPLRAQRLHRLADIDEIASFWRLPIPIQAGFPGFDLDVGSTVRPGQDHEKQQAECIHLGTFADGTAHTQLTATVNREELAKHGLVVGVPGSGKTTTVFNILHQLWATQGGSCQIPFLVMEPAKTEYRALKQVEGFQKDMLIFTLGDERTSPFRLNPFEVPRSIPLESHIARLNACFTGAFDLFDPLPLLLDRAIRETYEMKGWFDDSIGGEQGCVAPTLSDLCQQAELVIGSSGYSDRLRDDFNAALLQRLESLRRGSKGRMLDTQQSISLDLLLQRPVVLELDALNENEKALLMMFVLTLVYEYAKANRRSGSPLSHILIVEEAHNLIGRGHNSTSSEFRANPKEHAIQLFVRMLAEMRALGQGILIADQLPTALAPEAMKQTNLKILMRMTAMDDRTEIGNTMDLDEAHLRAVTRFKSGQALVYLEEWDRVRYVQTPNFKNKYDIEEPPDDKTVTAMMESFERYDPGLFMPFPECSFACKWCNRRVRSQAERFARSLSRPDTHNIMNQVWGDGPQSTVCRVARHKAMAEACRLYETYGTVDIVFPFCAYVHLLHATPASFELCSDNAENCECRHLGRDHWLQVMLKTGQDLVAQLSDSQSTKR